MSDMVRLVDKLKPLIYSIVFWLMAAITLDMFGVIDIGTDCGICIDKLIPSAHASQSMAVVDDPLLRMKISVLL